MPVDTLRVDPTSIPAEDVPSHVFLLQQNGASRAEQILFVDAALCGEMRAEILYMAITGVESPKRKASIEVLDGLLRVLRAQ